MGFPLARNAALTSSKSGTQTHKNLAILRRFIPSATSVRAKSSIRRSFRRKCKVGTLALPHTPLAKVGTLALPLSSRRLRRGKAAYTSLAWYRDNIYLQTDKKILFDIIFLLFFLLFSILLSSCGDACVSLSVEGVRGTLASPYRLRGTLASPYRLRGVGTERLHSKASAVSTSPSFASAGPAPDAPLPNSPPCIAEPADSRSSNESACSCTDSYTL